MPEIEQTLFSYVIDHPGDPIINKRGIFFGVQNCKQPMRPSVSCGDWVIATLGKNFDAAFSKKKGRNYSKYLVYAMRVKKKGVTNILWSNEYRWFAEKPVKLPKQFWGFIKKGRAFKCIKKPEKVADFEKWVQKVHKQIKPTKRALVKKNKRCLKKKCF